MLKSLPPNHILYLSYYCCFKMVSIQILGITQVFMWYIVYLHQPNNPICLCNHPNCCWIKIGWDVCYMIITSIEAFMWYFVHVCLLNISVIASIKIAAEWQECSNVSPWHAYSVHLMHCSGILFDACNRPAIDSVLLSHACGLCCSRGQDAAVLTGWCQLKGIKTDDSPYV